MKLKVWAMYGQPQWTEIETDVSEDDETTGVILFDTDGVPYIREG